MREERLATYDGIPARVAAGVAAAVLLTGLMYLPEPRFVVDEASGLPIEPVLRTIVPQVRQTQATEIVEEDSEEPEETPDRPAVRRSRPGVRPLVSSLEPSRTFVPPPRNTRRVDPVRLDPPPQLSVARLDPPVLPADPPNLQPPRRSPLRRFVSVLAVPFRHI